MTKFFPRILVVLLISSLVLEPAAAAGFSAAAHVQPSEVLRSARYERQALIPALVGAAFAGMAVYPESIVQVVHLLKIHAGESWDSLRQILKIDTISDAALLPWPTWLHGLARIWKKHGLIPSTSIPFIDQSLVSELKIEELSLSQPISGTDALHLRGLDRLLGDWITHATRPRWFLNRTIRNLAEGHRLWVGRNRTGEIVGLVLLVLSKEGTEAEILRIDASSKFPRQGIAKRVVLEAMRSVSTSSIQRIWVTDNSDFIDLTGSSSQRITGTLLRNLPAPFTFHNIDVDVWEWINPWTAPSSPNRPGGQNRPHLLRRFLSAV